MNLGKIILLFCFFSARTPDRCFCGKIQHRNKYICIYIYLKPTEGQNTCVSTELNKC